MTKKMKFIAEEGPIKGAILSLEKGDRWTVGRDPDECQLIIDDASVSRKQFICFVSPQGITVENLSATNPTLINNAELISPHLLQSNDLIKAGNTSLRFLIEDGEETPEEAFKASEEITEQKDTLEQKEPLEQEENSESNENSENEQTNISNEEEKLKQEHTDFNQEPTMPVNTPLNEFDHTFEHPEESKSSNPDTIFDEEVSPQHALAEINFGFLDSSRWMLKVVGGPNNGAEFLMTAGSSYLIGTDPNTCDIVFQDNSVSRQHLRITVSPDDTLTIEDLNSRNGTIVDGVPIKGKHPLSSNSLIVAGTTSFTVYDREGAMDTLVAPLMPAIVKSLVDDQKTTQENAKQPELPNVIPSSSNDQQTQSHNLGAFILIAILTAILIVIGIGTSTLFKTEPLPATAAVDVEKPLSDALSQFPNIKYSFNKNNGQLLLIGHVLNTFERNQLLYALQGLNFIKSRDDSGIVIDEYVWREINQTFERRPEWKSISISATSPGKFIVSGSLKTRAQSYDLAEYLSSNFPYPHLLENQVVVEEDIVTAIKNILFNNGFKNLTATFVNGEITINGDIPAGKSKELEDLFPSIREIRGVRDVHNLTKELNAEKSTIDISKQYSVSGTSKQNGVFSAVINGRILMTGDQLDGMSITDIQPNVILLEKDGTQYKIEFGGSSKK